MVYFGTIDGPLAKMQEIPCMLSPITGSSTKSYHELEFENGGVDIQSSVDSTKRYDLSFSGNYEDDELKQNIDVVKDYYRGIYGDGPIYFDDPTIPRGQNVLRRNWATPALNENGYTIHLDKGFPNSALYGEYVDVTAGYGAPGRALKIQRVGGPVEESPNYVSSLGRIVVPDGYTFYISGRGDLLGGYVALLKIGESTISGVLTSLSPPGSNELFVEPSVSIEGPAAFDILVMVTGIDDETSHATIQSLDGIILPNGVTPPATGNHMVGRGSDGFRFGSVLPYEYKSSYTGLRTLSVELIEVN